MSDAIVERIIREMSLREPQADSLRKLTALVEAADLQGQDQARIRRLLETGPLRFPDPYARLSFALATGVGKTRLMGAIMAWFYLTDRSRHFVLLAPSSTIYRKMQHEAVPTHPKYLFAGLAPFPLPEVITADAVESWDPHGQVGNDSPLLFVLTPGQIRPRSGSEVERRLRRENERLGDSFVTHLTKLPDLIAFLDEGHRYGQDTTKERAWAQAIADLTPKLVIEMTATPSNPATILYRYDLADALREGRYIKNVMAIVQQRTQAITDEEWDHLTLREGLRRLEVKKNAIAAFRANQPARKQVKPIMLVACRDTTHSQTIEHWLQSRACEGGKYQSKVLRVDITQSEEEIAKLLEVENPDNPTEIVVNVGMLREGWDVENVYVVAPLRATVSETLAIQTIGRGLRLPYGSRVDDQEVDTLDVLAFGRETVQQVIEAAKALGASARPSGPSGAHADYKQHEVSPSRKVSLAFPTFGHRVVDPPTLRGLRLAPQVSADPNQQPTVTLVDVPTGDVQQVEALVAEGVLNFPKRFAQLLIRAIPEVGGQEREAVRLFEDYFQALGCRDVESQRRTVQSRGADILQDVVRQVHEVVARAKEELEETQDAEACVFRPVMLSAPAKMLGHDQAQFPRDAAHLISGWKHSLYPYCRFDTAQEFQIAKILDGTPDITWVRNPVSQFAFVVSSGRHFPDFVVLEKHRIIFIESKDARELRDPNAEAYRVGKEATEQCQLASQASKMRWEYWAIPHDQVERCATLQDLAGQRFRFGS